MNRFEIVLATVLLAATMTSCSEKETTMEDCEAMADRYASEYVAPDESTASAEELTDAAAELRDQAEEIRDCVDRVEDNG